MDDFEDLRHRAFDKARSAHDVGFFWDVVQHLRGSRGLAVQDGSSGGITGSIAELVDLVRELMGKDLGDDEPLLRAKFETYLAS